MNDMSCRHGFTGFCYDCDHLCSECGLPLYVCDFIWLTRKVWAHVIAGDFEWAAHSQQGVDRILAGKDW